MTLEGTAVLDIVQHFVERWNEVKKRKACYLWRINCMLVTDECLSIV
jgi:hypothetical protein